MGFFSYSKTPKSWTGVITDKKIRKITDAEGDEVSRYTVVIDIESDSPRQISLDINRNLYDKAAVGNKVVKTEDSGKPVIQV